MIRRIILTAVTTAALAAPALAQTNTMQAPAKPAATMSAPAKATKEVKPAAHKKIVHKKVEHKKVEHKAAKKAETAKKN